MFAALAILLLAGSLPEGVLRAQEQEVPGEARDGVRDERPTDQGESAQHGDRLPPRSEDRAEPGELPVWELSGTAVGRYYFAHLRDSPAVFPDRRDTWIHYGYLELTARHRFGGETAWGILDHGVLVFSDPDRAVSRGPAGRGVSAPAEVQPVHEIYEAHATATFGDWVDLTAGRRFLWDGEGRHRTSPAGLYFSVTDGLHPSSRFEAGQPGFDGITMTIGNPEMLPVGAVVAVALQEFLMEGNENSNAEQPALPPEARYAVAGWAYPLEEVQLGVTWVAQERTMQRTGAFAVLSPGPFTLGLEGALEFYDPREERLFFSPLAGIRGEYAFRSERTRIELDLFGEYHYNGLARILPESASVVPVTNDGAAGFLRPGEHYVRYGFSLGQADRWRAATELTTNVGDPSTIARHELSVLALDPTVWSLEVLWTHGDSASEFGGLQEDFVIGVSAGIRF